jgi:hypothetical protein
MHAVMTDLRALIDEGAVWCAPAAEIAAWVCDQPGAN